MNKRILLVSPTARLGGGGEVVLTNMIQELFRNDYKCAVAVPFDGPYTDIWKQLGCQIFQIRLRPLTGEEDVRSFNPRFILGLCQVFGDVQKSLFHILKKFRPRIVYVNSFWAVYYVAILSRLMRSYVIWHVHDLIRPNSFNRLFVSLISRGVHQIIAISRAVERALVRTGAPKSKISIIHNGIDVKRFNVRRSLDLDSARSEFGISVEEFVVLAAGRLIRRKGYDTLIKAIAHLALTHPKLRLILLGEPYDYGSQQYMRELIELAKACGIREKVLFAGWQREVENFMAISDVVVSASWAEPFGLSIVEAMAAGLPVVATDGGGESEIVSHGKTGLLVPPRDEYKLAAALKQLAEDDNLRNNMGEAGRLRAESFFSTSRFISKILAILNRQSEFFS